MCRGGVGHRRSSGPKPSGSCRSTTTRRCGSDFLDHRCRHLTISAVCSDVQNTVSVRRNTWRIADVVGEQRRELVGVSGSKHGRQARRHVTEVANGSRPWRLREASRLKWMAAGRPPRSLPQKVGILRQITIRAARPGVTSKRFLLLPKPPLYNGGLGGKDSMEAALWKVPRILPANSSAGKF